MTIDLNCDMGEGLPNDAALMPFISSANIACGYHAGDDATIKLTIELALQHNVAIGAHPGFNDPINFGRKAVHLSEQDLFELVADQVLLLQRSAESLGTELHHIKPHGALYNMAAKDPAMAETIVKAVKAINPSLVFYGLSGSKLISAALAAGLKTASEVFADRSYQNDGSLTPRNLPHALLDSEEAAVAQVLEMVKQQTVTSVQQKKIPIVAETICIHGDGEHAYAFAKHIHQALQQNNIEIRKI
jgi:UPF0271 protein